MTSPLATPGHCKELLERISRYMDGELPADERARMERHLHDCPECVEVLRGLEHTVDLCREEGRPDLPPDLRARALERVHLLLAQASTKRK
jgi:anti-sigma factor (TIGR02949 family)